MIMSSVICRKNGCRRSNIEFGSDFDILMHSCAHDLLLQYMFLLLLGRLQISNYCVYIRLYYGVKSYLTELSNIYRFLKIKVQIEFRDSSLIQSKTLQKKRGQMLPLIKMGTICLGFVKTRFQNMCTKKNLCAPYSRSFKKMKVVFFSI